MTSGSRRRFMLGRSAKPEWPPAGRMAERSAHVDCSLLGFNLNGNPWLRRQLKNRSLLIFTQACQEHDLAIRKFKRIVMSGELVFVDLPKDRRLVLDHSVVPRPQSIWQPLNLVSKG